MRLLMGTKVWNKGGNKVGSEGVCASDMYGSVEFGGQIEGGSGLCRIEGLRDIGVRVSPSRSRFPAFWLLSLRGV